MGFPFLDGKAKNMDSGGYSGQDDGDIHHYAFEEVAREIMMAFKSEDLGRLTSALKMLCELSVSDYDKD